jgi:hypothetical protein
VPWRFSNAGRMSVWRGSFIPAFETLHNQRPKFKLIVLPEKWTSGDRPLTSPITGIARLLRTRRERPRDRRAAEQGDERAGSLPDASRAFRQKG